MRTGLVVLIAVLYAGCSSPTEPDTRPPILVVGARGEEQAQADQWWVEQTRCTGTEGKIVLHAFPVYVTDGYPLECPLQEYNGLPTFTEACFTYDSIRVKRSAWEGGVTHEFIHLIMQERGWPPDAQHTHRWWCECDKRNNTCRGGSNGS